MMQREIVLHAHAQGHLASKKTESIVSQEFYIPRLTKIVQDVITNCVPCILSSRKAGNQEGFLHPIPKVDQPHDCYHCDFLAPLPSIKKCYKHLFTVIDSFSKFVWIYPVKSTSTKDALDKLIFQQTIFVHLFPQRRGRRGYQEARVDVSYSQTTSEAMHELK
ncbi:transposon Tf2-9 polyprotein [Trichonephila clavipes]|nr:transposon Tf2-9 polyprotein [Trichonephila clavipes]